VRRHAGKAGIAHDECAKERYQCKLTEMGADERLAALLEVLQRDGRVEVALAADAFGAAEMTIRRDLDRMVAMGLARRVRGGAIEHSDAKRRIGAAVAAELRDGEAVVLDSGTTAVQVGRALAGRRLTVTPLSLHAATVLSACGSVRLLMPGGETRPGELAMAGSLAG
jgi:DeoR/GlpR family transcriptional regulator of sugar metabolism